MNGLSVWPHGFEGCGQALRRAQGERWLVSEGVMRYINQWGLTPHLAVRLQQALVDCAALEVAAEFGQPEEALVLIEQRERLFQRVAAVHQGEHGFEGVGVVELDEVVDAAVYPEARFAALAVLRNPGAAFADGFVVAEGEREQKLDLADADVGPRRIDVGR